LPLVAVALVASACTAATADDTKGGATVTRSLTLVGHPRVLAFITAAGTSYERPTAPLSTGDRILGQDVLTQKGSVVGRDFETCTVGFGLQVLCQDMLSVTDRGDVFVSWQFTWGASGQPPAAFEGVVTGGTRSYRNVHGDFDAVVLPNQAVRLTATITQ
jgi:hypothetical protein